MSLVELLKVPKVLLKDCPFTSASPVDWLNYLNKIEDYLRNGSLPGGERHLLNIYEYAIEILPELWEDEIYTALMMRLGVLRGGLSPLFAILNLNAPSNARLMIALAYYFSVLGNLPRVESVFNRAKAYATCDLDKSLLDKAVDLHKRGLSFRPFMGIYDYVPIYAGAWGNKLRKDSNLRKGLFLEFKDKSKASVGDLKPHAEQYVPSNCETSEANDSDTSMEVVNSEFQSPDRRPRFISLHTTPQSLQQIGEEDEEAEEEDLSNKFRNDNKENEDEGRLNVKMSSPPPLQTFDESSCVHMCSKLSLSVEDIADDGDVTVQAPVLTNSPLRGEVGNNRRLSPVSQVALPRLPSPSDQRKRASQEVRRKSVEILQSAEKLQEAEVQSISELAVESTVVVKAEKFTVLRQIARGGFSEVYCVMNKEREMRALKRVEIPSSSPVMSSMCKNELGFLTSLRDSGRVISLYNYELTSSRLVMVLELAEQDLKTHLRMRRETASLSDHVITFFWTEMLACVKVIHDHRIVHLDLKPENFVIVRGMLKLIDLGISQRLPLDCTHMDLKNPMGSVVYMSPEQIMCITGSQPGKCAFDNEFKVRLKTDVWALGIILYEMIHNRVPFGRVHHSAIMSAITSPDVPIPFPPVSKPELDTALKRCLVRDVRRRACLDELLGTQASSQQAPEQTQGRVSRPRYH